VNKRKVILTLVALLVVGALLAGTGCTSQKQPSELEQLQQKVDLLQAQILKEKQEKEAEKQRVAEEERIAQLAAKIAEEKLVAFEAKLAEKEKADRLAELEKKMTELESQRNAAQPGWKKYPSSSYPSMPYYDPIASFRAEVYRGDNFQEYVGILPNPYPIAFDWGQGGPLGLTNHFSVRWEGSVWFPEAGNYRFFMRVNEGTRLYVDGNLLLNKWSPRETTEYEVTSYLSAGYHQIRVDYRELKGPALIFLRWEKIQ